MAEKFRRIKREEPLFVKNISPQSSWLVGLVLVLAVGAGLVGWYYWKPDTTNQNNETYVQETDRSLAAIICRAGECFWLNEKGISFNKSAKSAGNLVPTLEDKTGRELKVGVELLEADILTELTFLKQKIYEDLGLNLRSGETSDANFKDFDFVTSEGWRLRLSTAENAYKTLETLKQTLAEIKKTAPSGVEGLEYVDLRVPNKVYYKFR